eukprot:scaffold11655_cov121-Isochrysis_galbana.AAC.5
MVGQDGLQGGALPSHQAKRGAGAGTVQTQAHAHRRARRNQLSRGTRRAQTLRLVEGVQVGGGARVGLVE